MVRIAQWESHARLIWRLIESNTDSVVTLMAYILFFLVHGLRVRFLILYMLNYVCLSYVVPGPGGTWFARGSLSPRRASLIFVRYKLCEMYLRDGEGVARLRQTKTQYRAAVARLHRNKLANTKYTSKFEIHTAKLQFKFHLYSYFA